MPQCSITAHVILKRLVGDDPPRETDVTARMHCSEPIGDEPSVSATEMGDIFLEAARRDLVLGEEWTLSSLVVREVFPIEE